MIYTPHTPSYGIVLIDRFRIRNYFGAEFALMYAEDNHRNEVIEITCLARDIPSEDNSRESRART
jgi:hypothetical protein